MKIAKNILSVILSFLPAVFHYRVTGPMLWNHGSSAGVEACIGLWICSIGLIAFTLMIAYMDMAPSQRWRRG